MLLGVESDCQTAVEDAGCHFAAGTKDVADSDCGSID